MFDLTFFDARLTRRDAISASNVPFPAGGTFPPTRLAGTLNVSKVGVSATLYT